MPTLTMVPGTAAPGGSQAIAMAVPSVGDSLRDLQASHSVGAQPILVLTGKGRKTQAAGDLPPGTRIFKDLSAAVDSLVS